MRFGLVFLGSGLGGMLRYGVGIIALRLCGPAFPVGTLAINVVGSALMGLVVALFAAFQIGEQDMRLFLTTGVIGGFTTFSTFSLDAVSLFERGEAKSALAYVVVSIVASIGMLLLTMHLARRFG